ncbi:hypothetical protein AVEN_101898-1 [Araneus ventricosus]|uniref:Uncharacterized protein n=1 Tax=Araneus ventricosus TaxID=182803 RepID=A0A4Y2D8I6_ARAVE|nr:hypothetical protein AVEN_240643-1 [Araneus ventricosus]GBM13040.1 hypothetical protein AVEN_101898-1 [Araneus ventricosus]
MFSSLCELTPDVVVNNSIDLAVNRVTDCIIAAADISIPKTLGKVPKLCKPWWNDQCKKCQKALDKTWNKFRRYATTQNLIKFKKAQAEFRRIRRVRIIPDTHVLIPLTVTFSPK